MSIALQLNPFEYFVDANGTALDAGYIWIGEANKYSPQFPVVAYFDEALTIPAAMPLRTSNGYVVRNGSPSFLYINGNYSVLVQDKNGRQIYYVPDFLLSGNGTAASVAYVNAHSPKLVTHVAALKLLDATMYPNANTLGYYAALDGGASSYHYDPADTTTLDNGVTCIVGLNGARWKLIHNGEITAQQCGFRGDGVTVNTASMLSLANIAVAAAGASLKWSGGTFIGETMLVAANQNWIGNTNATTILKAKNGLNADFVTTLTTANVPNVWMSNIQIDGNMANNSSGNTLTLKGGRHNLSKMVITKSAASGFVTDYDTSSALDPLGFESIYDDILIDTTNKSGLLYNGANDSTFKNLTIIDPGISADNTYYGAYITQSARFTNIHVWNRSTVSNTPSAGVIVLSGGCNFINSHFEGGHTPLKVQASGCTFTDCAYYAPRGAYCVENYGTGNKFSGSLGIGAASMNPVFKGVLNSTALSGGADNIYDMIDLGCIGGAIEWAGAGGGGNFVRITGFRSLGVPYVGTPAANDDVLLVIQGAGGGELVQQYAAAWRTYPTVLSSVGGALGGGAAASFRYQANGKLITWEAVINVPANGTATGGLQITTPFTAAAFGYVGSAATTPTNQALQTLVQPSTNFVLVTNLTGAHPIGASGAIFASGSFERV